MFHSGGSHGCEGWLVGENRESYEASWAVNMFGEDICTYIYTFYIYIMYIYIYACFIYLYRFQFFFGAGWVVSTVSLSSPSISLRMFKETDTPNRTLDEENDDKP